uniref:ANKLE2 third alpha/beta domain-containing protein n=1 Tax=Anopheles dirus TaxID=7168 RepID=A0A182NNT5_9DIPT
MEYYAIFIPDNTSAVAIESFYNDRAEALAVLKKYKNARMKAFPTSEEAVLFYKHGSSELDAATPACPLTPIPKNIAIKTKFVAPTSQKLVAFRKLIEANNVEEVRATIYQNPRYLISSGDTPTILKEGPRYNALHITAIEGRAEICRMILQAVSSPSYVELMHGQRSSSTDEVSAILLDLYLNTPDKCRSETPLHFAAKLGWVEVVRELIAFPQCQIIPNGDGLYAKDIVCSRAKAVNDAEQTRVAIGALLQANYFVPVMRTQDNVDPPVVGEPFSPTDPQQMVTDGSTADRMRMRREIRAYAGPMDQDKAQEFCKRWKTPPRLKVLAAGLSKSEGKLAELRSSTPVRVKPRRLFANNSIDMQQQEQNLIDGEGDDLPVTHRPIVEQNNNLEPMAVGKKYTSALPDDNGNHLWPAALTNTPHRLFFAYRNLANDSFLSEDGSLCGEANVSFVCEETQTLYGKDDVTKSPSYAERSIRITDPNKGLETVGRMLATKLQVGWQEYWEFLDMFCNLADASGLAVLEAYLAQRAASSNLKEAQDKMKEPSRALYDELDMICEKTEKMCLEEYRSGKLCSIAKDVNTDNGDDEEDEYYSCSDHESDWDMQMGDVQVDRYFTPPSSPNQERKPIKHVPSVLDHERQEMHRIFLHGLEPTREDYAVQTVLRTVEIDPETYPHVHAWKCAMTKLEGSQCSH